MTQGHTQQWLIAALGKQPQPWPDVDISSELKTLALQNGVNCLLYFNLKQRSDWNELPEELRLQLMRDNRHEIAAELSRAHEIKTVLQLLHDAGIEVLLLKGTPLAYSLYPYPHLRSRCDTDLLFRHPDDAKRAWKILHARGYQRPNTISGQQVSQQFSCHRSASTGLPLAFDLHWQTNNRPLLARALPPSELFDFSIPLPALGPSARTLSYSHALLLACVHRLAHKRENLHNRLIWLYDIYLMMQKKTQSDWQNVLHMTKEKKLSQALLDGLQTSGDYFGEKIPGSIQEELKKQGQGEYFTPESQSSRLRSELSRFKSLRGWKPRLLLLKEHLFPSPDYILKKYQTTNPLLLPWLYIKRIVQGMWRLRN